jgi:uncharacterized protein (UPF0276 family)
VIERVRQVQDILEAPLVLENPSSYLQLESSTLPEWEFLRVLAEEADCGLLLDVNNVYVSAYNHGFAPETYLAHVPWERVVQLHVAGHTSYGTHIIDTHIGPVSEPVWQLLAQAHRQCRASILLEWDAEIPDFEQTHAEACRAHQYLSEQPA